MRDRASRIRGLRANTSLKHFRNAQRALTMIAQSSLALKPATATDCRIIARTHQSSAQFNREAEPVEVERQAGEPRPAPGPAHRSVNAAFITRRNTREPKDLVMSSSPRALGVAFAPALVKGESIVTAAVI